MKPWITVFCLLFSAAVSAQALRDINYSYQYNADEAFLFTLRPVKLTDHWKIYFALVLKDTSEITLDDYSIEWEGRENLTNKEGVQLTNPAQNLSQNGIAMSGFLQFSLTEAPAIIMAKVVNNGQQRAHIFYKHLDRNYPVNNSLNIGQSAVNKPFVMTNETVSFSDTVDRWVVSYYNDNFPAAAPAFSEGQGKVSKGMASDSAFVFSGDEPLKFFSKGLFLFQKDTMSSAGFAIRAENDFPRYSLVQNLSAPLIYICTKQEYDKLELAKGDKKIFDRTVLSITRDAERARNLIRTYFRRVEIANILFTDFKEGWKTDRGMIYIIFGLPQEVFRFNDREVWTYKNEAFNVTFNFTRAPSIFAPDNYVLIRDAKYRATWYEVIDLWRNVRF
jgi:GWxTD domain-containing protein